MASIFVKPRLSLTCNAEGLARGHLAELFFRTSQTAKTLSSFTVISLVDAREGSFPFRSRLRRSFEVSLFAEIRGSLEGVRERGFLRELANDLKSTYRSQGKIFSNSIVNHLANWFKKLAKFRRMCCYPGKNLSLKSVKMRTSQAHSIYIAAIS